MFQTIKLEINPAAILTERRQPVADRNKIALLLLKIRRRARQSVLAKIAMPRQAIEKMALDKIYLVCINE